MSFILDLDECGPHACGSHLLNFSYECDQICYRTSDAYACSCTVGYRLRDHYKCVGKEFKLSY